MLSSCNAHIGGTRTESNSRIKVLQVHTNYLKRSKRNQTYMANKKPYNLFMTRMLSVHHDHTVVREVSVLTLKSPNYLLERGKYKTIKSIDNAS